MICRVCSASSLSHTTGDQSLKFIVGLYEPRPCPPGSPRWQQLTPFTGKLALSATAQPLRRHSSLNHSYVDVREAQQFTPLPSLSIDTPEKEDSLVPPASYYCASLSDLAARPRSTWTTARRGSLTYMINTELAGNNCPRKSMARGPSQRTRGSWATSAVHQTRISTGPASPTACRIAVPSSVANDTTRT